MDRWVGGQGLETWPFFVGWLAAGTWNIKLMFILHYYLGPSFARAEESHRGLKVKQKPREKKARKSKIPAYPIASISYDNKVFQSW